MGGDNKIGMRDDTEGRFNKVLEEIARQKEEEKRKKLEEEKKLDALKRRYEKILNEVIIPTLDSYAERLRASDIFAGTRADHRHMKCADRLYVLWLDNGLYGHFPTFVCGVDPEDEVFVTCFSRGLQHEELEDYRRFQFHQMTADYLQEHLTDFLEIVVGS